MKDQLKALIDSMTENEVLYSFTFLSKMFKKEGAANA